MNDIKLYEDLNIQLYDLPLINPSNLERFINSTKNNPAYLLEIFESFLDDSKELLHTIEISNKTGDLEQYFNSVHSLKGLAGTMGFSRLFSLLKAMDTHNKENSFDESSKFIPLLKKLLQDIEVYINSEFAR